MFVIVNLPNARQSPIKTGNVLLHRVTIFKCIKILNFEFFINLHFKFRFLVGDPICSLQFLIQFIKFVNKSIWLKMICSRSELFLAATSDSRVFRQKLNRSATGISI